MKRFTAALAVVWVCVAAAPEPDKGKIIGVPTAPIRMDVFSDFECPACKNFHEQLLPLIVKDYVMAGKVYVVSHEFPLNIPAHAYSREEANYATAAAHLGIYQPVADALFKNQPAIISGGKVWETVASVLTADQQKRLQALAKDPAVLAEVQHDVDEGNRERVSSTPTIFVTHGTQHFPLPYPINYGFLRSLLDGLK